MMEVRMDNALIDAALDCGQPTAPCALCATTMALRQIRTPTRWDLCDVDGPPIVGPTGQLLANQRGLTRAIGRRRRDGAAPAIDVWRAADLLTAAGYCLECLARRAADRGCRPVTPPVLLARAQIVDDVLTVCARAAGYRHPAALLSATAAALRREASGTGYRRERTRQRLPAQATAIRRLAAALGGAPDRGAYALRRYSDLHRGLAPSARAWLRAHPAATVGLDHLCALITVAAVDQEVLLRQVAEEHLSVAATRALCRARRPPALPSGDAPCP